MKCKNSSSSSEVAGGRNVIGSAHSVNMKRPREGQHPKYLGSLHVSFYLFYGIFTNPLVWVELLLFITDFYPKILRVLQIVLIECSKCLHLGSLSSLKC